MGETISKEMGAPISFATRFQAGAGMGHFKTAASVLETFHFHEDMGADGDRARADRCGRHDHAVELAGEPDLLQGCGRTGGGLHDGAEAVRGGAVLGAADCRDPRGSGRAEGRVQSRQR